MANGREAKLAATIRDAISPCTVVQAKKKVKAQKACLGFKDKGEARLSLFHSEGMGRQWVGGFNVLLPGKDYSFLDRSHRLFEGLSVSGSGSLWIRHDRVYRFHWFDFMGPNKEKLRHIEFRVQSEPGDANYLPNVINMLHRSDIMRNVVPCAGSLNAYGCDGWEFSGIFVCLANPVALKSLDVGGSIIMGSWSYNEGDMHWHPEYEVDPDFTSFKVDVFGPKESVIAWLGKTDRLLGSMCENYILEPMKVKRNTHECLAEIMMGPERKYKVKR